MDSTPSPAIQRLRCLKQPRQIWPKGKSQPLTKELAQRFCDLISTSLISTAKLLADHPDLPCFKTLETWRYKHSWFNSMWKQARQQQAEFLMQHCLDMANAADPKSAHVVRVRFDIYRFLASKLHPEFYGDKSQQPQQQTTVNVGIAIDPQRLNDLRVKLDQSRTILAPLPTGKTYPPTLKDESRTRRSGTAGSERNTPNGCADSDAEPAASNPDPKS